MLLTVYAKAYEGGLDAQLAQAAADGFEAVELRGDLDGTPLTRLAPERFENACKAAEGHGLVVVTLALGQLRGHAGDPDGLRHVGKLAASCGARVRLFSSDRPGAGQLKLEQRAADPEPALVATEAEALRCCVQAVRGGGATVPVMIEAEPWSIANSVARQASLLDAVGAEHTGFNWDFVNHWMGGEHPWPDSWPSLAGRLLGIHYKGAKADPRAPAVYASQALPLEDDLPHAAMWRAWAADGFEGPVTVDPHYAHFAPADRFQPEPANPAAEICRRTLPVMRTLRAVALQHVC